MSTNILIVEDEFIIANDLRMILTNAGYQVCGIATSVDEAMQLIAEEDPTWVMLDIYLQDGYHGTDLALYLNERNIGFMYISANTDQATLETVKDTHPYGFLVKPFREKDLLIMLDVASRKHQFTLDQLAMREKNWKRELAILQQTIDAGNNKASRIAGTLQSFIPFDFLHIYHTAWHQQLSHYGLQRTDFDEYQVTDWSKSGNKGFQTPGRPSKEDKSDYRLTAGIFNGKAFQQPTTGNTHADRLSSSPDLRSRLTYTIVINDNDTLQLSFFSKKSQQYTIAHQKLLEKQEKEIGSLLRRIQFDTDKKTASNRPQGAGQQRPPAMPASVSPGFAGIIGNSAAMIEVFDKIGMVANSDISVLITGESGTGKEQVAKCLHATSHRSAKPMVVVNCAALPGTLIESELFGHEKGSFTGATDRRIGKFELADGGTIFLDEIGELSLEAQVKFLRVLQEMEFDRIGSGQSIKVNIRVIAATNKRLEHEVANGRFRLDLYYRLNVFPIELPPLRDRKEDIIHLTHHFIEKLSARHQRNITGIAPEALQTLLQYAWPGNIRELEHVIERSCVATRDHYITQVQLTGSRPHPMASPAPTTQAMQPVKKLDEMEAAYIVQILKSCNGKISGAGGAAAILGLPASTLQSKIKKLGIRKEQWSSF